MANSGGEFLQGFLIGGGITLALGFVLDKVFVNLTQGGGK